MNQEQLMKVKIKYLEDRINTLEKSIASVIEHQFSTLNVLEDKLDQGFKDIGDDNGNIAIITDEREQELKSKDNGNELI